jgi:hypothetical protein
VRSHSRPLDFVESYLSSCAIVRRVQLSTYRRLPRSTREERTVHHVASQLFRRRFNALLRNVGESEEIAFDSILWSGAGPARHEWHLPLVDFRSADLRRVRIASALLVGEYRTDRAALFASGRAYHLYLGVLLTREQWVEFMGRILLLNSRGKREVVDSRWVGHRLLGGFGALRWSANTARYRSFGPPRLVREWS